MSHYVYPTHQPFHHAPHSLMLTPDAEVMLLARLKAQVEYYFSPQNLARDAFLRSLLSSTDHRGAVPITAICNFPKVRELVGTTMGIVAAARLMPPANPAFIAKAIEDSHVVSVSSDGLWITPNTLPGIKNEAVTTTTTASSPEPADGHSEADAAAGRQEPPNSHAVQSTSTTDVHPPSHSPASKERLVVIVRDLPVDCTMDEVIAIFTTAKSARLEAPVNTWYITFNSEADAVEAVAASWTKTIREVAVRARFKSEAPMQQPRSLQAPRTPIPPPHSTVMTASPYASPYPMPPPPPPGTPNYAYSPVYHYYPGSSVPIPNYHYHAAPPPPVFSIPGEIPIQQAQPVVGTRRRSNRRQNSHGASSIGSKNSSTGSKNSLESVAGKDADSKPESESTASTKGSTTASPPNNTSPPKRNRRRRQGSRYRQHSGNTNTMFSSPTSTNTKSFPEPPIKSGPGQQRGNKSKALFSEESFPTLGGSGTLPVTLKPSSGYAEALLKGPTKSIVDTGELTKSVQDLELSDNDA